MRCRFFEDRISAGDFWGPAAGLRPLSPVPASAGLARVMGGERPGAAAAAGERLAGATAVAWAAAPGGASVRERFAAGDEDIRVAGVRVAARCPNEVASGRARYDTQRLDTSAARFQMYLLRPSYTPSPPLRRQPQRVCFAVLESYLSLAPLCRCSGTGALSVSLTHYKLMSTPAFLAAAVVLGLAGAYALIKHRSKKTIPRLPDAKLD